MNQIVQDQSGAAGESSPFQRVEQALQAPGIRLGLQGSFAPEAGYVYRGKLSVGDQSFDLAMENFPPQFPLLQTGRDLNGSGPPLLLSAYRRDPEEPVVMTLDGQRSEIRTVADGGAQLLPLLGRLITDNTP